MAKKLRYIYDEETCTFQPEVLNTSDRLKRLFTHLAICVAAGVVMLAVFFLVADNPKTKALTQVIANVESTIVQIKAHNEALTSQVDELHEKDNSIYRSILGMNPMDDGIYAGGEGGRTNNGLNSIVVIEESEEVSRRLRFRIQTQRNSFVEIKKEVVENSEMLAHIPIIRPVKGRVVSFFGFRFHPIDKRRKMHTGLDLHASTGTPIYATGDAVVKMASYSANGYGKQIDLNHNFGFITKYAHLSKILVKQGQRVKRGEVIGYSGNTGKSVAPHLHYEVIKNGVKIDPLKHLIQDYSPSAFLELKKESQRDDTETFD
ncbi:MAG: M23 family metallopeptidase [Bacteroidia bacterium]